MFVSIGLRWARRYALAPLPPQYPEALMKNKRRRAHA
jgi:hypothetical protein